jgi:L-threonylcarbamoyladenylate synthase
VAFPTETVYGLGANALDAAAVARIFEAKGRPRSSPLIVHVDSIEMARARAEWPDAAETLARRYWPGPLTLVVPKRVVPDIVTAGLPTVGLRMPAHPLALELIRAGRAHRRAQRQPLHRALAHRSPGRAGRLADYVLDGGPARWASNPPCCRSRARPLLLRPGVIPAAGNRSADRPGPSAAAAHSSVPSRRK